MTVHVSLQRVLAAAAACGAVVSLGFVAAVPAVALVPEADPPTKQPVTDSAWEQQLRQTALTNVVLGAGTGNAERNLVWHTDSAHSTDPIVELAVAGEAWQFPTTGVTRFEGAQIRTAKTLQERSRGFETWAHKLEFTQLQPATSYVYRIGQRTSAGDVWLGTWRFTTESGGPGWQFFFMADAQIGAKSGHKGVNPMARTWEADSRGWQNTLDLATATYPEITTLVSAGDQVNSSNGPKGATPTYEEFMNTAANPTEVEYLGYTNPRQLKELQHAPTLGNHDDYYGAELTYESHYNIPNYDWEAGKGTKNHWWGQNNVLFLHLNTELNDPEQGHFELHDAWLTKVLKEQRANYQHVAVVMHRPLYSVGEKHSTSSTTDRVRKLFTPLLKKHGISILLTGHDHSYSRSHVLDNFYPGKFDDDTKLWTGQSGEVLQLGTGADAPSEVFLTGQQLVSMVASTASGSKYYAIKEDAKHPYVAVQNQDYVPTYSVIDVDSCAVTYITHRAEAVPGGPATNSLIDRVRVNLPAARPTMQQPEPLRLAAAEAVKPEALLAGLQYTTCDDSRFAPQISGFDPQLRGVPQTVRYVIAPGTAWEVAVSRQVTVEAEQPAGGESGAGQQGGGQQAAQLPPSSATVNAAQSLQRPTGSSPAHGDKQLQRTGAEPLSAGFSWGAGLVLLGAAVIVVRTVRRGKRA